MPPPASVLDLYFDFALETSINVPRGALNYKFICSTASRNPERGMAILAMIEHG